MSVSNRIKGYVFQIIVFVRWLSYDSDTKEYIRRGNELKKQDELEIVQAVQRFLIPPLPIELRDIISMSGVDTLRLFLAINSVSLMAHSWLRNGKDTIEFSSDGSLVGNECVVQQTVVVSEIARFAGLSQQIATELLAWIRRVIEVQPRLFPSVASHKENDKVMLTLDELSFKVDLQKRWEA